MTIQVKKSVIVMQQYNVSIKIEKCMETFLSSLWELHSEKSNPCIFVWMYCFHIIKKLIVYEIFIILCLHMTE